MLHFLSSLVGSQDNELEATLMLTDLLGVKVSRSTVKTDLEEHPDYPSLLSISEVLERYGIENLTAKFNAGSFSDIPCPFITQVKGEKKKVDLLILVRKINEDTVDFFDPEKHRWSTQAKNKFLERWSGIVLLAEVRNPYREKNYEEKRREESNTLYTQWATIFSIPFILLVAGLIAFVQQGVSTLLPLLFCVLMLIGGIIGLLLLWYEIDRYNPVLQQICTGGKEVNCNAVLTSKGAKILGVSWSVAGFIYFGGGLISLLLSGITNLHTLAVLSWLSLLVTPYVFYSVYYQWKVAGQWCTLCLSVQGVLVLACIVTLIGGWYSLFPFGSLLSIFLAQMIPSYIIIFIAITLLLPALRKAKESRESKLALQRLKHSPQIFEALLQKQKAVTVSTDGLGITLGNPEATHKLIKVCNPYCGPCAQMHTPLEELLDHNPDLQVQIIFTATNNDNDIKLYPVRHLLAIAGKGDQTIIKQSLDDWYLADKKSYEVFAAKYPMSEDLMLQGSKITAMEHWCEKTGIAFTPTFFINGYQLPEMYTINDLKHFLSV